MNAFVSLREEASTSRGACCQDRRREEPLEEMAPQMEPVVRQERFLTQPGSKPAVPAGVLPLVVEVVADCSHSELAYCFGWLVAPSEPDPEAYSAAYLQAGAVAGGLHVGSWR